MQHNKEKTMSMKVKVKKVFDRGIPKYEILELKGLSYNSLPLEYINGRPRVYFDKKGEYIVTENGSNTKTWNKSRLYSAIEIEDLIDRLTEAGDRLKAINDKIRELKKTWVGEVTYRI